MSMHTLTQFKDYLEKFITISNNLGKKLNLYKF